MPDAPEDLAQASPISTRQDHSSDIGPFFRATRPGEPNHASMRSHLAQAQLDYI